jgi:glycyl-tRNA synthetase (class II)
MKRYDHITLDYSKQPPMMTCKHCGGQHNLDDMIEEEVKPSPTVSPERLAEILLDYDLQLQKLMHSSPTFGDFKKTKIGLATELLKALDISEKE